MQIKFLIQIFIKNKFNPNWKVQKFWQKQEQKAKTESVAMFRLWVWESRGDKRLRNKQGNLHLFMVKSQSLAPAKKKKNPEKKNQNPKSAIAETLPLCLWHAKTCLFFTLSHFLWKKRESLKNGSTVGSGLPRAAYIASVGLLPLRPVAHLPGHPHPTHPPIHHIRRLRLFPVRQISLFFSRPPYLPFFFFLDLIRFLIVFIVFFFFPRRFVGVVFGTKGTDAILSVEYFCCDRPNPILQVYRESCILYDFCVV